VADETDVLGRPWQDPRPTEGIAADREELLRQQSRQKTRDRQDDDVMRRVMRTKNGRDWLRRFLEDCHIFGAVVDFGSQVRASDPLVTYFRDGERNVGLRILEIAQRASAQSFQLMMQERTAELEAEREGRRQQIETEN
jgi:hypothetical protein